MSSLVLASVAGVLYLLFVPLTAWLALRRDRSPFMWGAIALVTGPVATVVLAFAPPGACPSCKTPVAGWPAACTTCGSALDDDAVEIARPAGTTPATGQAPVDAAAIVAEHRAAAIAAAGPPPMATSSVGPVAGALAIEAAAPVAPVAPVPAAVAAAPAARSSRSRKAKATTVVDDAGATTMLATAMFVTGSDLQPGLHYLIATRGRSLVVLGPVESDPHLVALQRPLRRLRVTAFSGDLLINDVRPGWSLGFANLHGGTPEQVERALLDGGSAPGVS